VTQDRTRVGDEKYCGACAEIINKAAAVCPKCGVPQTDSAPAQPSQSSPSAQPAQVSEGSSQRVILGAGEKHCSSCGSVVKIMAELCPNCGVRQSPNDGIGSTSDVPVKNKWVAVILALWIGGLGAHKFYLGKYAQGIIYLVLFWTAVPFFIGWVEAVIYAFTPQEGFSERYSQRR
jgi:TM2 domain-containing membrane protein YozV/RNA polymerase subunit RPABC4/transcription elongation factor Spt4